MSHLEIARGLSVILHLDEAKREIPPGLSSQIPHHVHVFVLVEVGKELRKRIKIELRNTVGLKYRWSRKKDIKIEKKGYKEPNR